MWDSTVVLKKNKDSYTCYVCEGITPLSDADDINSSGIALDWDKVATRNESYEKLRAEDGEI